MNNICTGYIGTYSVRGSAGIYQISVDLKTGKMRIEDTLPMSDPGYMVKSKNGKFNKNPEHLIPLQSPPFYAVRCQPSLLVTHGGIKISPKMEALDKDYNPVPGLYAVGVDTGGIDADTYNCDLPAHSFGFAMSSGRIAGKEAAEYTAKKNELGWSGKKRILKEEILNGEL